LLASDEEKLQAYSDPAVRQKLHDEVVEWQIDIPGGTLSRQWYDYIWVEGPVLAKNKEWQGKSLRELAQAQGKGIIDAFLDMVVE
jgi:N-acyl-D-aspartate/D-glutamate deacylase